MVTMVAAVVAAAVSSMFGVVTDAVYLLSYNFLGGPRPVAPFPDCGPGGAEDEALGCANPPAVCRQLR